MVDYGHKIEEKVKAMKSGIKENVQGTKMYSEGKESGTHQWFEAEGRNKHSTGTDRRNKNTKNKMKRSLGTSVTTLNIPIPES